MAKTSAQVLAKQLNIHPARGLEAIVKAKLIRAILMMLAKKKLTHSEISLRSGVPRSAVTGILNGSLQKVSLDRLFRLLEAAELTAEIRIKEAA